MDRELDKKSDLGTGLPPLRKELASIENTLNSAKALLVAETANIASHLRRKHNVIDANARAVAERLNNGEQVAVLVFGKQLRSDGTLDRRGRATVEETDRFYNAVEQLAGKNISNLTIILSGNKSANYEITKKRVPSEASVMRKELVARGVRSDILKLENRSCNTEGNVILSALIIRKINPSAVVLICEDPMKWRTMKLARRVLGDSIQILSEPAKLEINGAYGEYNKARERLGYLFFLISFAGVPDGDIDNFYRRLNKLPLYSGSRPRIAFRLAYYVNELVDG
jgi:uncharacterized SAM-binding protein YcdF (DUF218 family)